MFSLEYPGVWSRNILAARNCGIAISPLFSGWFSVTYAKGDKKGSIEAPFLSTNRIQTAFITAGAKILPPSSAKNTTGQQPGNVSLEPEGSIQCKHNKSSLETFKKRGGTFTKHLAGG